MARQHDPKPIDDDFAERLVDLHQAIMAGETNAAHEAPTPASADPAADVAHDLAPAREVLKLIERVRRRDLSSALQSSKVSFADSTGRAAEDTEPSREIAVDELPETIGRFRILRKLGQGGYGVVLLAEDPRLKRLVALKVPRPQTLMTADLRARFLREAETAAALNHPHVVPVYEVGSDGPLSFIVSGYCHGASLAEWLQNRQQPLPPPIAAELIATLADAIQHAHSRGVLHRDLKPANILLEKGDFSQRSNSSSSGAAAADEAASLDESEVDFQPGELAAAARIADFGLAKLDGADGSTLTGSILGTPSYMSPEQAEGDVRHVGPATDTYSLGAILYELLTGRPPFAGGILETLQAVRQNEPLAPRRVRADIPRDLEAICLKCLEKSPDKRYPSPAALAEDLRRHLEGKPVIARSTGHLERGWRWCRRNPLPAALIVLVFVAMVGGTVVSTYFAIDAGEKAQLAQDSLVDAQTAQLDLVNELYFHRIALAEQEWKANNVARARELLDACPPDQRCWEWFYLRRMIETGYKTLTGHEGPVLSVAYNSDGTVLASGGQDGKVILWDGQSTKKMGEFPGSGVAVWSIAFDPTRPHLAAAVGKEIVIWDWSARRELRRWEARSGVILRVDYSVDGKLIASDGDKHVALWSSETGEEVSRYEKGAMDNGVRFDPNGSRLVTAGRAGGTSGGPIIWDFESGEASPAAPGHEFGVGDVDFNSAGDRVATVSYDGMAMIWDAASSERLVTLQGQEAPLSAVRFSPNGRRIAAAGNSNAVWIWDSHTGRTQMTLRGHTSSIYDLSFHPGGEKLASAGSDGTVRIWDVVRGQQFLSSRSVLEAAYRPHVLTFSPDGRWIAIGLRDREHLMIVDSRTLREEFTGYGHERTVWQAVFSPDGAYLVSASDDGRVIIRNTKDWKPLHVLEHDQSAAGTRTLLPENPFESLPRRQHDPRVRGLALSADGSRLISTAGDTVRIWSMPDGQLLSSFSHANLTPAYAKQCIAVTSDGRTMYSAGHDAKIRVWDLATGQQTAVLEGHSRLVNDIALDTSGRWLISAGEDLTAKLWRTEDGALIREFPGNTEHILSVLFSQDGRRVFTGSSDGLIRIWDTDTGRIVLTLHAHNTGRALGLSSDGHRLVSTASVGDFKVWNATPLMAGEIDPTDDPRIQAASLFSAARLHKSYTKDPSVALDVYPQAIAAFEKLRLESPDDKHVQLQLSKAQLSFSDLLHKNDGDPVQIRNLLDSALSLASRLVEQAPDDILYQEQLGLVCFKLSSVTEKQDLAEGQRWIREAIKHLGNVMAARPLAINTGNYLRQSRWRLMEFLARADRAKEAIDAGLEALEFEQSLVKGHENNPSLAPSLTQREQLQTLLREAGRDQEADRVQILTELIGADIRAKEAYKRGQTQQTAGDNTGAIESFQIAVDASALLVAESPDDRSLQLQLARSQMGLGNNLPQSSDEAIDAIASAVAILEKHVDAEPGNGNYLEQLAIALHILGDRYSGVDLVRREECYRRAISCLTELFTMRAESHVAWDTYRWSHWNLMRVLSGSSRTDEAIECGLKAVAIEEMSLDDGAQYPALVPILPNRDHLAALLRGAGRTEEAEAIQRRADELRPAEELASLLVSRGKAMLSRGERHNAITNYRRASELYGELAKSDGDNLVLQFEQACALSTIGDILKSAAAPPDEIIEVLNSAVSLLEPLVAAAPENVEFQSQLGLVCHKLAAQHKRTGVNFSQAEHLYRQAVYHRTKVLSLRPEGADTVNDRSLLRWSYWGLTMTQSENGRIEEAIEAGLQAEEIEASLPADVSKAIGPRARLKALLRDAGRHEEADAVVQRLDELRPPQEMAAILFQRAEKRRAAKDHSQAMEDYRRSIALYAEVVDGDADDLQLRFEQARAEAALGKLLFDTGAPPEETIEVLLAAAATLAELVAADSDNVSYRDQLGNTCHVLAWQNQRDDRDLIQAEKWFRSAIEHRTQAVSLRPGPEPNLARSRLRYSHWALMELLANGGRVDEAIEQGLEALAVEEALSPHIARSLTSRTRLEDLLRDAGRSDEADALRQRADALEKGKK